MRRTTWGAAVLALLAATTAGVPNAHAAPPANDDRANAETVVLSGPSQTFVATGHNGEATTEPAEAERKTCGAPIGATVWFKYAPSTDLQVDIDTIGSAFDTVLGVWREAAGNEAGGGGVVPLGLDPVACNDDIGGSGSSAKQSEIVGLALEAGTTYYIQLAGFLGALPATGSYKLTVDQVNQPGSIAGVISARSVGGTVAVYEGCADVYQTDGTTLVGGAEAQPDGSYTVTDVPPGTYKLVATDCADGTHEDRWYQDSATAANATPISVSEGAAVTGIDVTIIEKTAVPNDHRVAAAKVVAVPSNFAVDTKFATLEPANSAGGRLIGLPPEPDPSCTDDPGTPTDDSRIANTVWYRYQAAGAGSRKVIADAGSTAKFFPVVAVYSFDPRTEQMTQVGGACAVGAVGRASASFTSAAGSIYYFQVGGVNPQAGAAPGGPMSVRVE